MSVNFEILYENLLKVKIAIVHDSLMCRGGAEQVTLCFHEAFPHAPIYTLCYQPNLTFPEFKECEIRTTWLQPFVKTDAAMKKLYFPFGIMAMKQLDVTDYDVVLISSTHCAKYVKVHSEATVISYCYTPFRLAWNPTSYIQYAEASKLKKSIFDLVLNKIRNIDYEAAQRTDYFIAMTEEMAGRIRNAYGSSIPISLLNPPVDAENYYISDLPKQYYLLVSRLEYYKRVDLVIDAFNITKLPLVVIGKGTLSDELKDRAGDNIIFMGGVSSEKLIDMYANCKALVFPQYEDYGLTPLEANAAGRPVIAYGSGGVLTTQVPITEEISRATALFFQEQSVESLNNAVEEFEKIGGEFDSDFIRGHAGSFGKSNFIDKIRKFVLEKGKLQVVD